MMKKWRNRMIWILLGMAAIASLALMEYAGTGQRTDQEQTIEYR
jgi:hypothetical protein